MNRRIRKAVFPVAGRGTRMLPATKAVPKEMLPIVDRPLIEYAVEEAHEAGIDQFVFVVGPDMKVTPHPVVTGTVIGDETVIERGVAAGATVVTDGQLRLMPGATVRVKDSLQSGVTPAGFQVPAGNR